MSSFRSAPFLLLTLFVSCGVATPDAELQIRDSQADEQRESSSALAPAPVPTSTRALGMLEGVASPELSRRLGGNSHKVSVSATRYDFGASGSFIGARVLATDTRGLVVLDGYAWGGASDRAPTTTSMVVNGQQVSPANQNEFFQLAMISVVPGLEQLGADGACGASSASASWGCWWEFFVMAGVCAASIATLAAALAACLGTAGTGCVPAALIAAGAGAACANEARNWFCCMEPTHPWCVKAVDAAEAER